MLTEAYDGSGEEHCKIEEGRFSVGKGNWEVLSMRENCIEPFAPGKPWHSV